MNFSLYKTTAQRWAAASALILAGCATAPQVLVCAPPEPPPAPPAWTMQAEAHWPPLPGDDASRVAVADAAAVAAEARERFEANAAALTALQQYIRSAVMQDTEKTK